MVLAINTAQWHCAGGSEMATNTKVSPALSGCQAKALAVLSAFSNGISKTLLLSHVETKGALSQTFDNLPSMFSSGIKA